MITTLYEDATATREWLLKAPRGYVDWLKDLQRTETKQVKTQDELRYIYRSQGRLEIVDRLLGLPEELLQKGRS